MPLIVSNHQKGFIRGRNIKDCVCLAFESLNIDKKSLGGKLDVKVDVIKAFDTLIWCFLLKVLETFNFGNYLCNLIKIILESAHHSVNINGASQG